MDDPLLTDYFFPKVTPNVSQDWFTPDRRLPFE